MPKLKPALSIAVIATLAVLLVIQHQSGIKQREEINSLRQQLEPLSSLATENERLANLVAHANSPLSKEQLSDLLRLRSEVNLFRRQTNELQMLRARNQQLQAVLTAAKIAPPTAPSPTPGLDAVPSVLKESWTFTGYATPEAGFQSLVWAMSKGDGKTFLASLSPTERARMEKEFDDKSEGDIAKELSGEMEKVTGFRVMGRQEVSDNEVILVVYADGMEKRHKMNLKKFGNEWKMDGRPENVEEQKQSQ